MDTKSVLLIIATIVAANAVVARGKTHPSGCSKVVNYKEGSDEYIVRVKAFSPSVVNLMIELTSLQCGDGYKYRTGIADDSPDEPLKCTDMVYIHLIGFSARLNDAAIMWLCHKINVEYIEPVIVIHPPTVSPPVTETDKTPVTTVPPSITTEPYSGSGGYYSGVEPDSSGDDRVLPVTEPLGTITEPTGTPDPAEFSGSGGGVDPELTEMPDKGIMPKCEDYGEGDYEIIFKEDQLEDVFKFLLQVRDTGERQFFAHELKQSVDSKAHYVFECLSKLAVQMICNSGLVENIEKLPEKYGCKTICDYDGEKFLMTLRRGEPASRVESFIDYIKTQLADSHSSMYVKSCKALYSNRIYGMDMNKMTAKMLCKKPIVEVIEPDGTLYPLP